MDIELLSDITGVQIIAVGRSIRELRRLRRTYGKGRWRKMKGFAVVRFIGTGVTERREVH